MSVRLLYRVGCPFVQLSSGHVASLHYLCEYFGCNTLDELELRAVHSTVLTVRGLRAYTFMRVKILT